MNLILWAVIFQHLHILGIKLLILCFSLNVLFSYLNYASTNSNKRFFVMKFFLLGYQLKLLYSIIKGITEGCYSLLFLILKKIITFGRIL